jgi:hypothetical protein
MKMNDFGDVEKNDHQENQDVKAQEDADPSNQILFRFKSLCIHVDMFVLKLTC